MHNPINILINFIKMLNYRKTAPAKSKYLPHCINSQHHTTKKPKWQYLLNKTLLLFTVTKIPDYLEKEQVDELLQAAKTCNERDYLLLRFMWRTGVRVSEAINVTPNDIEFKNGVVNIRKAKGGRQRRVPLDEETLKMLSDYVSNTEYPRGSPYFFYKTNASIQSGEKIREYSGA